MRYYGFAVLLGTWLLSACTVSTPKVVVNSTWQGVVDEDATPYWWYARFRFEWSAQQEPDWSLGVLVADQIVRPVLSAYPTQIDLWRVHRRAADDGAGHQFSFIFRATVSDAANIYQMIEASPWLVRLRDHQLLRRWSFDDLSHVRRKEIQATSDPSWSDDVQRSWPYFIQGVCQMWLALIDRDDKPTANASLEEWLTYYQARQEHVTQVFAQQGQHALLHHLNAIFGYQYLNMRF